jgi:chemotaxis protein CheC
MQGDKMDKLLKLTDMEIDALREVGNIGVGNAATALSKVLNRKISIMLPDTKFIPITQFSKEFGGPESIVTAIYLKIQDELEGEALFIFNHETTLKLIDLLMGNPLGTTKIIDEIGMSALKEMTNIFSGAYLTALSNFFKLKVLPSIPHVTNDMVQAILDFILVEISTYANNILAVKTKIDIEGENVGGEFLIFFQVESYKKMLSAIRTNYGIEKD